MIQTIHDEEFGDIAIRSHRNASRLALKIAPNGTLYISAPRRVSRMSLLLFVRSARSDIRTLIAQQRRTYITSQPIGKSHNFVVQPGSSTAITMNGTKIIATLNDMDDIASASLQETIRGHILKALRKEAKGYLPRRLSYMAAEHTFHYESLRFTHSSSRWGSCSSKGTISLNIALMSLPFELIDYVLAHELCHIRQMNHSPAFWAEVAAIIPDYKLRRAALKQHTPHI